jgi:hypothetical protein
LLAPDGHYEHLPLRFVRIGTAQLDVLDHAAQALADPNAHDDLAEALAEQAEANGTDPADLAGSLSRVVSVLALPWDDGVRALREAVTRAPEHRRRCAEPR